MKSIDQQLVWKINQMEQDFQNDDSLTDEQLRRMGLNLCQAIKLEQETIRTMMETIESQHEHIELLRERLNLADSALQTFQRAFNLMAAERQQRG